MTRRTLSAALLAAALVALTFVSAPHSTADPVGGTTVSISGSTATITVHEDICCSTAGAQHEIDSSLLNAYENAAAALWNQAFANLGCVTFHLAIDVHLLDKGQGWESGYHQISMDFDGPGRPGIHNPPGDTSPATNDWTNPYTSDLSGDYYFADMTARTFAHETGHMMGLGDDYTDQFVPGQGPRSVSLPGRDGTLMDGGSTIDADLANRITTEIGKAGYNLPKCQTWTGAFDYKDETEEACQGGGGPETDSWDTHLDLSVDPKGVVRGTASATANEVRCGSGGVAATVENYPAVLVGLPVSGHLDAHQFDLTGVGFQYYFIFTEAATVDVPLTSPKTAAAQLGGTLSRSPITWTATVNLLCTANC